MCISKQDPFVTSLSQSNLPQIHVKNIDDRYSVFQAIESKINKNKRIRVPSFEVTPKKKFFDRSLFAGRRVGSISVI